MIERYEQQLKAWKAKRRELRAAEAKRAKREAENERQQELVRLGLEVEAYRRWMQFTVVNLEGEHYNLLEFYEETKDDSGIRFIGELPE